MHAQLARLPLRAPAAATAGVSRRFCLGEARQQRCFAELAFRPENVAGTYNDLRLRVQPQIQETYVVQTVPQNGRAQAAAAIKGKAAAPAAAEEEPAAAAAAEGESAAAKEEPATKSGRQKAGGATRKAVPKKAGGRKAAKLAKGKAALAARTAAPAEPEQVTCTLGWTFNLQGMEPVQATGVGTSRVAAKQAAATELLQQIATKRADDKWFTDVFRALAIGHTRRLRDRIQAQETVEHKKIKKDRTMCTVIWDVGPDNSKPPQKAVFRADGIGATLAEARVDALTQIYLRLWTRLDAFTQGRARGKRSKDVGMATAQAWHTNAVANSAAQKMKASVVKETEQDGKEYVCRMIWNYARRTEAGGVEEADEEAEGRGASAAEAAAAANDAILVKTGMRAALDPDLQQKVDKMHDPYIPALGQVMTLAAEAIKKSPPDCWDRFLPHVFSRLLTHPAERKWESYIDQLISAIRIRGRKAPLPPHLWEDLLQQPTYALALFREPDSALRGEYSAKLREICEAIHDLPLDPAAFPGEEEAEYYASRRYLLELERLESLELALDRLDGDIHRHSCTVKNADMLPVVTLVPAKHFQWGESDRPPRPIEPGQLALVLGSPPPAPGVGDKGWVTQQKIDPEAARKGKQEGPITIEDVAQYVDPHSPLGGKRWVGEVQLVRQPKSTYLVRLLGTSTPGPVADETMFGEGKGVELFILTDGHRARVQALRALCAVASPPWAPAVAPVADGMRQIITRTQTKGKALAAVKPESHAASDAAATYTLDELEPGRRLTGLQRNAVRAAIRTRLATIQGPAGSGKTEVAAAVVSSWARISDDRIRVLAAAASAPAAHALYAKIRALGVQAVCYGSPAKLITDGLEDVFRACETIDDVEVQNYIDLRNLGAIQDAGEIAEALIPRAAQDAKVVVTTLHEVGDPVLDGNTFSHVIIDEGQSCQESLAVGAVARGCSEALVLVGDMKSVRGPPPTEIARLAGAGVSLMRRVEEAEITAPILLREQHRMHPVLNEWPNMRFYDGKVMDAPATMKLSRITGFDWPNPEGRLCFVNLDRAGTKEGAAGNVTAEIDMVARICERVISGGGVDADKVSILTPHRSHRGAILVKLHREVRRKVRVETISEHLGSEADLVIFSPGLAEGGTGRQAGEVSFPNNVCFFLTRARRGLIVVGSERVLKEYPIWAEWIAFMRKSHAVHTAHV